MPIYVASSEETFSSLHENIIEKNSAGYQTVATAQAICVSMRMFHGEITTIQKENPTLLKVQISFFSFFLVNLFFYFLRILPLLKKWDSLILLCLDLLEMYSMLIS